MNQERTKNKHGPCIANAFLSGSPENMQYDPAFANAPFWSYIMIVSPPKEAHNSKPCISNTVLLRQYASNETCIVPTGFAILDFGRLAATKDQKTDRDSYRARQKACNAIQPMPKHPSDLILWLLVLQRKPKSANYDYLSLSQYIAWVISSKQFNEFF